MDAQRAEILAPQSPVANDSEIGDTLLAPPDYPVGAQIPFTSDPSDTTGRAPGDLRMGPSVAHFDQFGLWVPPGCYRDQEETLVCGSPSQHEALVIYAERCNRRADCAVVPQAL